MRLSLGTRLGPYELLAPLGSGAMGDVYRARDTRLDRDVAIKVLPAAFAQDVDRLGRFEREARAVAAINHPNILAVHDIGGADVLDADRHPVRTTYMVTELLDGETLRARLAQGPLPPRKAAEVAMQIARGLSAAHDRGIVHRDLKPENIVLVRDGHVKILDFGLAKQTVPQAAPGDQRTMVATDAGMILGTVGYMAPEQVRGENADARSDLFALGSVLFELASGRRAFERPTAAETMTAILREDPPDLTSASFGLSSALDRVVRHALEKDPNDRFQSARDFAFALQSIADATSSGTTVAATAPAARRPVRRRERAAWVLATLLGGVTVAALWWPRAPASASASPMIFAAALPWDDAMLESPAVSPDGTRIAFIADRRGSSSIVVRALDGIQTRPIKGTAGAQSGGVFWSPDGGSIAFFAGGRLKTVDLATERLEELASAPLAFGGAWGPDGTILFSPDARSPILRVNADGGDAVPVTELDAARHDEAHRWPQFLPDGRHFVFMPWTSQTTTRLIHLGSLDGGPSKPLFTSDSAVIVAGTSLLFVQDLPSRLMAQAFNPRTLALEGRPVAVVADDNVAYSWQSGHPLMTASAGTIAYTTGKHRQSQLTWITRAGRPVGTVGDPDVYYDPLISPDGAMLAVEKRDPDRGSTDLWTVDLARGAFSRLTSTAGFESIATWSADGRRIAFASDNAPSPKVLIKNANGTGSEEAIIAERAFPSDWSRDNRYLLFTKRSGTTGADIWAYDVERKASTVVLASPFGESRPKLSPDGKWMVYVSDETRQAQVYARSFPDGAVKVPISSAGGDDPAWRSDGKELYYLAPDGALMAVDVRQGGAGLVVGAAQPLFQTKFAGAGQEGVLRNHYTVSADGQRFLMMWPIVDPSVSQLIAVVNWSAALPRTP